MATCQRKKKFDISRNLEFKGTFSVFLGHPVYTSSGPIKKTVTVYFFGAKCTFNDLALSLRYILRKKINGDRFFYWPGGSTY